MGPSLRCAMLSHTITGVLLMQAQSTERTRLLCSAVLSEPPILGLLRIKRLEDYGTITSLAHANIIPL